VAKRLLPAPIVPPVPIVVHRGLFCIGDCSASEPVSMCRDCREWRGKTGRL